jgi:hypothetical protein
MHAVDGREEVVHRDALLGHLQRTSRRPRRQVVSTVKETRPMAIGNQPPSGILMALAAKKAMSTSRKAPATSGDHQRVPAPQQDHDEGDQDGVDQHRAGDRDAVGGGQVGRALEAQTRATTAK